MQAFDGRPVAPGDTRAFTRFDATTRRGGAGTFEGPSLGTVTIDADGEGFGVRVGRALRYEMFPVSDQLFYVPGLDLVVAFSDGRRPARMHIRSMDGDVVAERR